MTEFGTRSTVSSAVKVSGTFFRYAFYATGMLAFVLIAFAIVRVNSFVSFNRVKTASDSASFRIVEKGFAKLPMQSKVTSGGAVGRIEVLHYGRLHDRAANLSIALVVPPKPDDRLVRPDFAAVRTTLAMNATNSALPSTARYDLETRFGPVRASETRVNADGLIKPCLLFYSRFDTEAVRLMGVMCEADGSKPSPHGLACVLDGLVLEGRLPAEAADRFLREHMSQRPRCTATPVSQTIDNSPRRRPLPPAPFRPPPSPHRH
jgi:hypothetical protein